MRQGLHTRNRRIGGFTAIELLTVLVIVGIVMSLGMPSMDGYFNRSRTRRALDRVVADVAYARVLAVQQGRPTAIRLQTDGTYRVETMSAGGAWTVVKTVGLRNDYAGVTLSGSATSIEFSSRGLVTNDAGTESFVKVQSNGVRDSVFVSPAGRVYRAF